MERRVAVIGATGFIGSHLSEHLVRAGAEVLAVARSPRRRANLATVIEDCQLQLCDILDRARLDSVLCEFKPEVVYHLAAEPDAEETFAHIASSIEANALGTVNVLEAACGAGAGLVVYADSAKVYGNGPVPYRCAQAEAPRCSYAIGKAAGWRLCRLAASMTGIAVCALRPTFVYGPRQNRNLITHVRDCVSAGKPVQLLGGSQTRDLLFVEDAVRAFAAVAERQAAWGSAIPIGGGRELNLVQICREIVDLMGGSVEIVAGAHEPRLTEIWRSWCDNAEAGKLLDWNPQVGLPEGLARTLFEGPPVLGNEACAESAWRT
jgi:UDP-glucose 4-epimerase